MLLLNNGKKKQIAKEGSIRSPGRDWKLVKYIAIATFIWRSWPSMINQLCCDFYFSGCPWIQIFGCIEAFSCKHQLHQYLNTTARPEFTRRAWSWLGRGSTALALPSEVAGPVQSHTASAWMGFGSRVLCCPCPASVHWDEVPGPYAAPSGGVEAVWSLAKVIVCKAWALLPCVFLFAQGWKNKYLQAFAT